MGRHSLAAATAARGAVLLALAALASAAPTVVKYGQWNADDMPFIGANGTTGFEAALRKEICALLAPDFECQLVLVPTLDDRISWLQNGTIDVSMGVLSVTPERQAAVNILRPGYYVTGTALFYPTSGAAPTYTDWAQLAGVKVCTYDGAYTNGELAALGVVLVVEPQDGDVYDITAGVASGACAYFVADSSSLFDGYAAAPLLPMLDPAPYGIALSNANKNSTLAAALAAALTQLATAPEAPGSSALRRLEREVLVPAGLAPLEALKELEASVTALASCGGAGALPGTARAPGSGIAARPAALRVGMVTSAAALFPYDVAVKDALCAAVGAACTVVPLQTWDDRIPALKNGSADVIVAAVAVTAERAAAAAFVRPFYYATGTSLFVPTGAPLSPAPASWDDVKGVKVCMGAGDVGIPAVEAAGAVVVPVPTLFDAQAAAIAGTECVAMGGDTGFVLDGLALVPGLPPLAVLPLGVMVAKDNAQLAATLSAAMVGLSVGNTTSLLQDLEASLDLVPLPALEVSRDLLTNMMSPCKGNSTAPPPLPAAAPPPAPGAAPAPPAPPAPSAARAAASPALVAAAASVLALALAA